jgi:serine/threonine protein kinase
MVKELAANTTLSHYTIISKIGEGGMGQVYRARDSRLDREVAIKILPQNYSSDADRLKRFEQEARATSALNHPNILTVFDIGTHAGAPFIVSELLAGEELRDQLKAGPLTQRSVIDLAQQIAQGLAAAHGKGITHRDLKPENLFVTTDGRLKILDFGLAKLRPQRNETSSEVATAKQITGPGTVMGTVAYMSPEQVRGQDVDHRSDIFSFGSILYEMLTGERAFRRETTAETMTAILKEEPTDFVEINEKINPALLRIVRRCLEKNPERRFQSASDLGFAIEASTSSASTSQSKTEINTVVLDSATRRRTWPIAIAVAVGLFAMAGLGMLIGRSLFKNVAVSPVRRVAISLTAPLAMAKYCPLGIGRRAIALSPDGSSLVYSGEQNGKSQLFIRSLDSFDARPIPGTEGAYSPFFSPDGQSIAFFASNTLRKTSLTGGQPVTLTEARNSQGAAWGSNDTIVFADAEGTRLISISASGGSAKIIGTLGLLQRPDWGFSNPEFLPDGETMLLTVWRTANPDNYRLATFSPKTSKLQILLDGGIDAHYLDTGHIVYSRGATLIAAPFDTSALKITGPGVTLVENVRSEEWGTVQYSVSRDGTLVYVSGGPAWVGNLVWTDRKGSTAVIDVPPHAYLNPSLSPDGKQVAVEIAEATRDIHLLDFARGGLVRFTNVAANICPHWSADGKQVTFARYSESGFDTVSKSIDSGAETIFMHRDNGEIQTFSPDGTTLLYMHIAPDTSLDLWVKTGNEQPRPWLMTKFSELLASYSSDGKYVAYCSDESGQYEIYVRPASGEGAKWQISTEGGEEPIWAKDGRELFYRNGQKWMAVDVTTAQEFKSGSPRLLFEGPYLNIPGFSYDVAADGRFLILEEHFKQSPTLQVQAIFNWEDEVKRRVPGGK